MELKRCIIIIIIIIIYAAKATQDNTNIQKTRKIICKREVF